ITAQRPPLVVVTSNRTRDLHEALKRRCSGGDTACPDSDPGAQRAAATGRLTGTESFLNPSM
ncbi:hypothetical protein WFJ45_24615, partial [Salmonella enterica subsp. enterica serovar Minnesota]|uniref:hypothetical protein n=1 Tax=Salmonella enterica TaxID=28901 RepID=UPI003D2712FA